LFARENQVLPEKYTFYGAYVPVFGILDLTKAKGHFDICPVCSKFVCVSECACNKNMRCMINCDVSNLTTVSAGTERQMSRECRSKFVIVLGKPNSST
jgi:hypothetical protein